MVGNHLYGDLHYFVDSGVQVHRPKVGAAGRVTNDFPASIDTGEGEIVVVSKGYC